ncbi:MAG: bifunctional DedA family/phosphatase PAP2 family protein [Sulfuricaulis sp.]
MIELIHHFISWTGAHPQAAGVIIALVSFSESLAFIGLIVPGSTLMIGAGVLVGAGVLEFWPTFAWSVSGAVIGDGVSYWLGHHYQDRLRHLRPLQRRPELLARADAFFLRHGGMSVVLARFVGPVRSVIPVVAGMLGMSPARFYAYNLVSALAWAPAHIIPGMVFGASLALAGHVALRLALLFGVLLIAAWIVVGLIRASYAWLQPRAAVWSANAVAWGQTHRRVAWLINDLLDPARPESRALTVWLVLLIAGAWVFLGVLQDVLSHDPLVTAGRSLYHLLQGLRTPLGDRIMVMLTELGDAAVVFPVAAAVLAWLTWRRAWRDAGYWLAALGFGALAVATIKAILRMSRPVDLYTGVDSYSFPSGHVTMSVVAYGFLAVLVAGSVGTRRRWIPYAAAALLIGAIAFSRLYLGSHWLADVAAGGALGVAWVAVLAFARERRRRVPAATRGLLSVAFLVFFGAGLWHIHARMAPDLERYAVRYPVQPLNARAWWEGAWRKLPVYRQDLAGEHEQPMNIQWAGELPVLKRLLLAGGWREPLAADWHNALNWIAPHPSLDKLPLLPQLQDGRYDSLRLVLPGNPLRRPERRIVLRLWPTDMRLEPGGTPVWTGTVEWQRIQNLPLLSIPRSSGGYDDALDSVSPLLTGLRWKMVYRRDRQEDGDFHWRGKVLLAKNPGANPSQK